jgi:hypothetical protein
MHESAAVLRASQARRVRQVVIVEGITAPESLSIMPSEFHRLHLDDRYQRQPREHLINDLITVLKNGGEIYSPITVCQRLGEEDRLYVVDGQQRMWAHMRCSIPIPARVHKSTGWQAEAMLFQVLNTTDAMSANARIKSYQGRAAAKLRTLSEIPGQPYYNQIDFAQGGFRPFGALILLRAMLGGACGAKGTGSVLQILPRLDLVLENDPSALARLDLLLALIPQCFPVGGKNRLMVLPGVGLGRAVHRRLRAGHTEAPAGFPAAIRRVNWSEFMPSNALKYLASVEERILSHWPE